MTESLSIPSKLVNSGMTFALNSVDDSIATRRDLRFSKSTNELGSRGFDLELIC